MKLIRKIVYFLGSAPLAITLIATVAMFVVAGTFIESKTESHRFASMFTYESPLFSVLIWLLFVNILVSALLRWPFNKRHIPFLITHLGLLMILSGVIIKNHYGVQGNMSLLEGGTSQHLLLPDTFAIYIADKDNRSIYELDNRVLKEVDRGHPQLNVALSGYYPHSNPKMEGWIKGKQGVIAGLPPFPVTEETLKVCCRARFENKEWNIYAVRTQDIENKAKELLIHGLILKISDTKSGTILSETTLEKALEDNRVQLILPFSLVDGFVEPQLIVENQVRIPLIGPDALVNINISPPYSGKAPITVDLRREPTLALVQDEQSDVFYFAFDEHGRIHQQPFRFDALSSVISYDEGYGGYTLPAAIPQLSGRFDRDTKEVAKLEQLLRESDQTKLAPPLEMLREASKNANEDFPLLAVRFLTDWEKNGSWLMPNYELPPLNWDLVEASHLRGCQFIAKMVPGIESELKSHKDLIQILEDKKWPLVGKIQEERLNQGPCSPEEVAPLLTLLSHQIMSVSEHLPAENIQDQSILLSALFRLYGIHLSNLRAFEEKPSEIALESPLSLAHQKKAPTNKLEDNIPLVVLEIKEGDLSDKISLAFDRFASGLKWPILHGKYLVRFQPRWKKIPYKIRLRDARQINYANTQQPYSYESDLLVMDERDHSFVEKTISMNNVHETWDGYRFYLSSISPGDETAPQRVQIVVNYDPAKYWLTYPGAILVSLGIVLLFIMHRPKRSS